MRACVQFKQRKDQTSIKQLLFENEFSLCHNARIHTLAAFLFIRPSKDGTQYGMAMSGCPSVRPSTKVLVNAIS